MIMINVMQYINDVFANDMDFDNYHYTTIVNTCGVVVSLCTTTSRCINCSDICDCAMLHFVTFNDLSHFDYY